MMLSNNVLVFVSVTLTTFAKLVLFYPWFHSVLNSAKCRPYGSLDFFSVDCTCIDIYQSKYTRDCSICAINAKQGSCHGTKSICNNKWMGRMCDQCHAANTSTAPGACSGDCTATDGWYNDASTGKCRFCNQSTTCNDHGRCKSDGMCKCDTGYALDLSGLSPHPQCAVPCPTKNNKFCSNQGTCVAGGVCRCIGSWCGLACDQPTSKNESAKPCNGNGYPGYYVANNLNNCRGIRETNTSCACHCLQDNDGKCMYQGPYCEHECPMGRGGKVCGYTANGTRGYPVYNRQNKNKCQCYCAGTVQDGPCTPYCYNGAQEINGVCQCATDNTESSTQCRTCKPGYYIPETGCVQYCNGPVTCNGGSCVVGQGQNVTCKTCTGNFDPQIVTYVQESEPQDFFVDGSNFSLQIKLYNNYTYLAGPETRQLQFTPTPKKTLSATACTPQFAYSNKFEAGLVYKLCPDDSAQIAIPVDNTTIYISANAYLPLATRIATQVKLQGNDLLYGAELPNLNFANINETHVACALLDKCVGYDKTSKVMYQRLCVVTQGHSCAGLSLSLLNANVDITAFVSRVQLCKDTKYNVVMQDTLKRGCHNCVSNNYYPQPEIAVKNNKEPCAVYCQGTKTCHGRGSCTEFGTCNCSIANMDSTCNKCLSGFFPEVHNTLQCKKISTENECLFYDPLCRWDENKEKCVSSGNCTTINDKQTCLNNLGCQWSGTTSSCDEPRPCSQQCDDDLFSGEMVNGVSYEGNSCAGHGFCNPLGYCECKDTPSSPPNGWGAADGQRNGTTCEVPCRNNNKTVVCGGEGKCVNGNCQCNSGYYGTHCEVTCNATDQYVWYNTTNGQISACNNPSSQQNASCAINLPCGKNNNSQCTRLRCNGGTCAALNDYQYQSFENLTLDLTHESCRSKNYKWNPINQTCYKNTYLTNIMYETCTDRSDEHPLIECLGITNRTYEAEGWTREKIQSELGIFCDTDYANGFYGDPKDDWKISFGFCARLECDCMQPSGNLHTMTRTQGYEGDSTGYKAAAFPTSLPLAGRACNYVGCETTEFTGFNYRSMCGSLPPPVYQSSEAKRILYSATCPSSDRCTFQQMQTIGKQKLLKALDTDISQYCSRGQCGPLQGDSVSERPGTQTHPAMPEYGAIYGQCHCKQAPNGDGCAASTRTNSTFFKRCCQGYDTQLPGPTGQGAAPFYGPSCGEQCSCFQNQFTRGTCAFGNGQVLGTACTCRASQGAGVRPSDESARSRLFCGKICKYQCNGIINVSTSQAITLDPTAMCPNANLHTPVQAPGCYDNLLPCSGHGECYSAKSGTCITNADVKTEIANCSCWGQGIDVSPLQHGTNRVDFLLPATVAVYGGGDCAAACPTNDNGAYWGNGGFYDKHYDDLRAPLKFNNQTHLKLLTEFATQYRATMCTGHGYCLPNSPVVNKSLECVCLDNYGGPKCDSHCSITANEYWARSQPYQDPVHGKNSNATELEDSLFDMVGLDICGPHMECGGKGKSCVAMQQYSADNFHGIAYVNVKTYLNLVTRTKVSDAFKNQWSLAFVGEMIACKQNHFTFTRGNLIGGNHYYYGALPKIVQWELARTCDATYQQGAWGNNKIVPWCCSFTPPPNYFLDDFSKPAAHTDEANYPNGYGGCPYGSCPAYAGGQMCTQCVSSAFTHWQPTVKDKSCNVAGKDGYGYCTICAAQFSSEHKVAPYTKSHPDNPYTVDGAEGCQTCVSSNKQNGADLRYNDNTKLVGEAVCSNNGYCIGEPDTYSHPDKTGKVKKPPGVSLFCTADGNLSSSGQLGLCHCNPGFNGPTCAMPTNETSCNGHPLLVLGGSPYNPAVGKYSVCKCPAGTVGFYCKPSSSGHGVNASLPCRVQEQPIDNGPPVSVDCNGFRDCVTISSDYGTCFAEGTGCEDPTLDPFAMCREYKAIGPNGIVALHQRQVAQRAGNCSQSFRAAALEQTGTTTAPGLDCSVHTELMECNPPPS